MKRIKLFESFAPSIKESVSPTSNVWQALGANWLFNYIMNESESLDVEEDENGIISMVHSELDIVALFFVHENEIRWTWSWGDGDYQNMIEHEIKSNDCKKLNVSGSTPKEFVKNVDDKISEVEAERLKDSEKEIK